MNLDETELVLLGNKEVRAIEIEIKKIKTNDLYFEILEENKE